jgi:hypothetical protein
MLAQVRAQFGNVPEHYIEFKPGVDGLSMRFLPPLSDILKKYETCRRARDLSADCGGQRDRALAKLADGAPPSGAPQSTVKQDKASAPVQKPQAAATESSAQAPPSAAVAMPPAHSESAQPAAQPPLPATPDRAAAQQKIGEDYAWCLRAKPKFECDQARTRALSELERPKSGKTKRPGKQAAADPKVAAAR